MTTKKLTDLSNLSLAAILTGLTSCAHVDVPVRPFYMSNNLDSVLAQPADLVPTPVTQNRTLNDTNPSYLPLVNRSPSYAVNNSANSDVNLEQLYGVSLTNYNLQLPTELTTRDTYVDTGLVQIALGDESIKVRPIYSPTYDISMRHPLRIERSQDHETRPYSQFQFQNDNLLNLPEDDPERIKNNESAAIAALARWAWSWSALQPIRVVANDVRGYSNDAVRSVFGSHSELDYSSGRLVFGFTGIKTEYFDVEANAWADVGDFNNNGLIIQMSFHGRRQ